MEKSGEVTLPQEQTADGVEDIPFLKNIALMQTYKCTIACQHCIMEAGPHRTEEMSVADSFDWLEQARAYRSGYIQGLALTGGEPFYSFDRLKQVADFGHQQGFLLSAVTNGYWADSRQKAIEVLVKLGSVRLLCISADQFHQKYIPLENVRHAAEGARELGMIYSFAVCTPNFHDPEYLSLIEQLRTIAGGDDATIRISLTFPVGRAKLHSKKYDYVTTSTPPPAACQMACSPVIFPDGKVMGCIGPVLNLETNHPLVLGNAREQSLAEILDRAESNVMLHAIRVWGPNRLVELLKERFPKVDLPTEYLAECNCDVCYRLFSDTTVVDLLARLQRQDHDFIREVAYGRLYYLHEPTMVEMLYPGEISA